METVQYIGENLWPGRIGHAAAVIAFVSSLFAAFSYFFSEKSKDLKESANWKKLGRFGFLTHGFSVFLVIGLIFFIMVEKMYEYAYAFNHVADDLSNRYILSAFWEGQEGSFLLWMFWHIILGMILLAKSGKWENGVMMFLSIIQATLAVMLLGIYFGDVKVGLDPFILLRETMEAPIFNEANYLEKITGSGLNPLLQNYWMTIHPPTLFLGFASVTVPFCYAAAALWTKRYKEWLKPVLPWALFSGFILGTGILMGGAWAYEALSFGGYWAWDPVENMSLVPWLIMVAGIHMNVVSKATGQSLKATFIFYLLSFILVYYSTFLTRSGILGDTSVHAFTELGLEWQLTSILLFYVGIALFLYIRNERKIPSPVKEESLSSREFWMFIGSLVLLFSTVLISFTTSIPVFNKLFDGLGMLLGMDFSDFHRAAPEDPVAHYNKYQIWIAVMIGVLSGAVQFLRYRESNFANHRKKFLIHSGIALGLSLVMTYLTSWIVEMYAWQYFVLVGACWYGVISNLDYFITVSKANPKLLGSALGHVGFGLMILGSVISGLNQHHISTNKFAQKGMIEGFSDDDYNKNILLIKGKPMFMSGYMVNYERDTFIGQTRTFTVNYKKLDDKGEISQEFNLYPNVLYNKAFSKIEASNPSTKHYLFKDIFTHVASLPKAETDPEYARQLEDSLKYISQTLIPGRDTFTMDSLEGWITKLDYNPKHEDYLPMPGDLIVGVDMILRKKNTLLEFPASTMAIIRGSQIVRIPALFNELNTKVRLTKDVFDETFVKEEELEYKSYVFKQGATLKHAGIPITFTGFGKEPTHPGYVPKEGDIAFDAKFEVNTGQERQVAKPMYLIRGDVPYNLKDEIPSLGLHFIIAEVDPKNEQLIVNIAKTEPREKKVTLEVAQNVPSSEYIVLEAIVFPGINLFWFGSIAMLVGFLVMMFVRLRSGKTT